MLTNILPAATAALADHDAAISFALDHLESFELADFLQDQRDGKDLKPWLDALEYDRRLMQGEPEEDIRHLLGK